MALNKDQAAPRTITRNPGGDANTRKAASSAAALKMCFIGHERPTARETLTELQDRYGHYSADECDVIVPVGGDGFMLDVLRAHMHQGKPFYGVNRGTVGFMMNNARLEDLPEQIANAETGVIHPLVMEAETMAGTTETALAINEVSLFRETRQSARIRISVNGKVRMESLTCDGVLLATPAGSTAYNLSAHGPILPISSHMLALTPISAFRPRRWRGALLPHDAVVVFETLESDKRPVSAVADNQEVRDVIRVEARENRDISMTLLFNHGQSLEERVLREQFEY